MGKNIVLCSDGTGGQDIKNRGTNVFKLYEAVDIQGYKDGTAPKQVAFYDDGVGTENPFMKVFGSAFGLGFTRNVKKMYRELVNVYRDGDIIYLFGFSRGAYTVRTLAGFIQYLGVLDAQYYRTQSREFLTKTIDDQWRKYRTEAFQRGSSEKRRGFVPWPGKAEERRNMIISRREKNHAVMPSKKINIAFIGVWDTVGAIGSPFNWMRKVISLFYPIWFADNTLGPDVDGACQALSIDDERLTFHPELWNEQNGADKRILQVWFSGVHSNVGGGYPKQGMSLVALDWMMAHAHAAGLHFINKDIEFVHSHQDVHDKLYDSRSGVWALYRWAPRDIVKLCAEHLINEPKIHVSVFERIANGTNAYAPGNIPFDCTVDHSGSLTKWPDPTAPGKISSLLIAGKTGSASSLLEKMDTTVKSGNRSYRAFLIVTLAAIAAFITLTIFWSLPYVLWSAAGFLICAGLIYRWALKVDNALYDEYAEFWHGLRDQLRAILK